MSFILSLKYSNDSQVILLLPNHYWAKNKKMDWQPGKKKISLMNED